MSGTLNAQWAHRIQEAMQQAAAALAAPSAPVEEGINAERLAAMIDHTLLKPEATPAMIDQLCAEARTHGFASVCVNACYVSQCRRDLEGSPVLVCTVAGFPLGATSTATKAFEARQAIFEGAREIDMVINVGWLKGGEYAAVREDVAAVVRACHAHGALCKVIIEAALLTEEEKVAACLLAADASADFVKTSTGFGPGGARVEDVRLMRAVVGPEMGIKAAGGIRDYATALAMVRAGATRIGASSSIQIVAGAPRSERVTD